MAKLTAVLDDLDDVEEPLSSVSGGVGGRSPPYVVFPSYVKVGIVEAESVKVVTRLLSRIVHSREKKVPQSGITVQGSPTTRSC